MQDKGGSMVSKTTYTGKGQSLALVILAGIDIVLGMIAVAIAINAGWPGLESLSSGPVVQDPFIFGFLYLILLTQVTLRLAMLIVMAWWTFRLVRNAHRHSRFPVSTRWAWLGWFVPVVSLWIPARILLNLNQALKRTSVVHQGVILSWWLTRLIVSPTLAFISLLGVGVVVGLTRSANDVTSISISWVVWMMAIGVVSQCLAIAVIIMTQRHQPKPGEIVTAELF